MNYAYKSIVHIPQLQPSEALKVLHSFASSTDVLYDF